MSIFSGLNDDLMLSERGEYLFKSASGDAEVLELAILFGRAELVEQVGEATDRWRVDIDLDTKCEFEANVADLCQVWHVLSEVRLATFFRGILNDDGVALTVL